MDYISQHIPHDHLVGCITYLNKINGRNAFASDIIQNSIAHYDWRFGISTVIAAVAHILGHKSLDSEVLTKTLPCRVMLKFSEMTKNYLTNSQLKLEDDEIKFDDGKKYAYACGWVALPYLSQRSQRWKEVL